MFYIGDMVRFIDDPHSFMMEKKSVVGKSLIGETGVVVSYDEVTKVYEVLVTGSSKVVRVMSFVMEKIGA